MKVFKDYLSKLEESSHYHALHGTDSWRSQMDNSQNKLMNMYKKQCEQNKRYREYFQKVINTDERLVDKQYFKDLANEALEESE